MKIKCSFSDCINQKAKKGLCEAHYQQQRKGKKLAPLKYPDNSPCAVEDCNVRQKAKGYCDTHYSRWRKYEDAEAPRKYTPKTKYPCEVEDCERTYTKRTSTKCARHVALDRYKARRSAIIDHYGGQCSCCGLADLPFLTIDHVNNDGNIQRKLHGTGFQFINYILNNWPEDLTVLCFNCNGAKGVYGVCPHQVR